MIWKLFTFMWRNAPKGMPLPVLALAVVTGLTRDAMLFVTIAAASASDRPGFLWFWLPAFLVTLLATSALHLAYPIYAQKLNAGMATLLRRRLVGNLLRAPPLFLQTREQGNLYHVMTSDVGSATYINLKLFELLPGVVFLAVAAPQVAVLSPTVGLFALLVMAGGVLGYWVQQRSIADIAQAIRKCEVAYFERVSDVIGGFRELKLHRPRRVDFSAEVDATAVELGDLLVRKERRYASGEVVVQALKYGLLGGVVFIMPFAGEGDGKSVFQVLTVILFALGPFESLIGQYPEFVGAQVALRRIEELDAELARFAGPERPPTSLPAPFRSLTFEAVTADYDTRDAGGFVLGPVDFELRRGETVFLAGDNGSGKTTFLNVLAGLLEVRSGRVLLDGAPLDPADREAYRDRFSAIFTTFHLFYRLFGLADVEPARARAVVDRLMLSDVTDYADGRFTRLALSSGQRRRLALAVVLLEDRDILILDEFVADQDPGKREFFFKVLLPELKAAGKTVVVSTHDLTWASYCDRLVHFRQGRIDAVHWYRDGVEIPGPAVPAGLAAPDDRGRERRA